MTNLIGIVLLGLLVKIALGWARWWKNGDTYGCFGCGLQDSNPDYDGCGGCRNL